MSVDVMYQPYVPYLPYQRPAQNAMNQFKVGILYNDNVYIKLTDISHQLWMTEFK